MGVRAGASLYDTVVGYAFGPVFDTIADAEDFIVWFNERYPEGKDLRDYEDSELSDLVHVYYQRGMDPNS